MVLPPQQPQKADRRRGQTRRNIGLEAQLPHPEVGSLGQLRQVPGQSVVIGFAAMICDDKPLAVGAVYPPFGKIHALPVSVIGGSCRHNAQAEALDLLGKQTGIVYFSRLIAVALQKNRPGKLVHRVGHLAEQAAEMGFPRLSGIGCQHGAVGRILGHPHVIDAGIQPRHAPRGSKDKQVAVKEPFLRADGHFWKPLTVPLPQNLVQLHFIPGAQGLVGVINGDLAQLTAQKLQPGQHRAAHIPQSHQSYAVCFLFRAVGIGPQIGKAVGKVCIEYTGAVA